jgi:competence protein ComEA
MTLRIGLGIGACALAALALWHPAPQPAFQAIVAPAPAGGAVGPHYGDRTRPRSNAVDAVVYVAGAVRHPGLYHARAGDRAANVVTAAGGVTASADAGAVNLAAHVGDGDEIYVPVLGERGSYGRSDGAHLRGARAHRARGQRASASLAPQSVDVNRADAAELASVPGIGRAIAARIVEMRALDGSFNALDELLDVAGMSQTRLERARPYLRL